MDNYDLVFFRQASPLLVVHSTASSTVVDTLNDAFSQYDLGSCVWDNSILKNRLLSLKYIIKYYHQQGVYDEFVTESDGHLICSPFNPKSDLFPNGILSQNWFRKYYERHPFAVVCIIEDNNDLEQRLKEMKAVYTPSRIRLVVIVVGKNIEDDRLNSIRVGANISKTDLYQLEDSASLHKDSETIVATITSTIKTTASSFYSDIQHRIKQRHKKYYTLAEATDIDTKVTLTPRFLETRNLIKEAIINEFISPHNMEPTLSTFETAYQNLIELLDENFPASIISELSDHDKELMLQFQNLIDTVAFHIVRGYLSVERPIVALKKHTAHVVNVTEVLGSSRQKWLSSQYEWLAELMSTVPPSILDQNDAKQAKKTKNKLPTMPFFGGFQFFDGDYYDVYSHPGLIFMKAASLLNDDSIHRAELLEQASNSFKNDSEATSGAADKKPSTGFIQYLDWELAQTFEKLLPKGDKALQYYESCFSYSDRKANWSSLDSALVSKLMKEYELRNNTEKLVATAVRAASMNDVSKLSFHTKKIPINSIDLEKDYNVINVGILCFKDLSSRSLSVFEPLGTQISIRPLVDLAKLADILSIDGKLSLTINSLSINYQKIDGQGKGNLKKVVLTHAPGSSTDLCPMKPDLEDEDGTLQGLADLTMNFNANVPKVIQVFQSCQRAGTYIVSSVDVQLEISDESGSVKIVQDKLIAIDAPHLGPELWHHDWVYVTEDGSNVAKRIPIRLHHDPPYMARVTPLKPKVSVSSQPTNIKSIVFGERVTIPFNISHELIGENKIGYGKVQLSAKVDIIGGLDGEKEFISTQVNWDNLKDDEYLSLDNLSAKNGSEEHKLNIALHTRPNGPSLDSKSYRLNISMQTWVQDLLGEATSEEDDAEIAVYDTALFVYPILNKPLRCGFSVFPRYRDEGISDMPCPFVVLDGEEAQPTSMPIVTRLWQGSLRLAPVEDCFDGQLPEIVKTTFNIRTKNQEVNIEKVGEAEENGATRTQLFTSRSKSGSHRNVLVSTSVVIEWRRPGQNERTNVFESEEWEIALPLSDPRVLLEVEEEDSQSVKLKYILENPTPRTFTFTTLLAPNETTDGTSWDVSDARNTLPLELPAFPVLPFNRHTMVYHCRCSNESETVDLPRFKVYDVHFKVFLPTLAVTRKARVVNKSLKWIKQSGTSY